MVCDTGMVECLQDCCIRGQQFCNHKAERCQFCSDRQVLCGTDEMPQACDLFCYKMDQNGQNQTVGGVTDCSGLVHPAYFWVTWTLVAVALMALMAVTCYFSIRCLRKRGRGLTTVFHTDVPPVSAFPLLDPAKEEENTVPKDRLQEGDDLDVPISNSPPRESTPFLRAVRAPAPPGPTQPMTPPRPPPIPSPPPPPPTSQPQTRPLPFQTAIVVESGGNRCCHNCPTGECRDRRLDGVCPSANDETAISLRREGLPTAESST